jgi:hypothetical protein
VKRRVLPAMKQPGVAGKRVKACTEANHQAAVFRGEPDYLVLIDLVVIRGIIENVASVNSGYESTARFHIFPEFDLRVWRRVRNDCCCPSRRSKRQ